MNCSGSNMFFMVCNVEHIPLEAIYPSRLHVPVYATNVLPQKFISSEVSLSFKTNVWLSSVKFYTNVRGN